MKNEQPTHLDLFSGIGGFALAAQRAGFRTIGFCEIDKYCQKVLAKNFLDVPIVEDIHDFLCALKSSKPLHSETSLSVMRRNWQGELRATANNVAQSELFREALRGEDGNFAHGSVAQSQCEVNREPILEAVNGCADNAIQIGSMATDIQNAKSKSLPDGDGAYSQEIATSARTVSSLRKDKANSTHTMSNRGRNFRSTDLRLIMDLLYANHATRARTVDLLTAGFPCQPYSVAGLRRGSLDDRALWPPLFEVIGLLRPFICLLENVPGIITMELDNVLSDLESIGYATRPFVIPACAVDARHRRDRLWIVARDISNASRGRREQCHAEPESENGTVCPGLPNTEYAETARQRQHGRNGLSQSEPIRFSEGSRSKHATWSVEPNVGRVVDGLSVELDFARQIATYEKSHRSKKKPESRFLIGKLLQAMWQYRELAETSPSIYVERLRCCVPEVPLQDSQSRWLLGARIQKEPNLLDLWSIVSTEGFAPAQNVQQLRLLERAWSEKRSETVGNRINRLKALGNAIVPQVAYEILREIRKLC